MAAKECLFCSIAQGKDPKSSLLYQSERVVVFRDVRPAAPHHYLAVPTAHIPDARALRHEDILLVEEMLAAGKQVLEEQGGKPEEAKLGFHLPPLLWVGHLHLHIIAPASQMGFVSRLAFRDNTFWYCTVESVLQKLRDMKPADPAQEDAQPPNNEPGAGDS